MSEEESDQATKKTSPTFSLHPPTLLPILLVSHLPTPSSRSSGLRIRQILFVLLTFSVFSEPSDSLVAILFVRVILQEFLHGVFGPPGKPPLENQKYLLPQFHRPLTDSEFPVLPLLNRCQLRQKLIRFERSHRTVGECFLETTQVLHEDPMSPPSLGAKGHLPSGYSVSSLWVL